MNNQPNADRSDRGSSETVDSSLGDLKSLTSSSPPVADARHGFHDGLLVCGDCGSRLVYPADCEEHGRDHWYIELKCADCGGREWARFDIDMLDALDGELSRAEAEIEADLPRLTRAHMADYVTRFVAALDAGCD
jgi:hypothetical protein